MIKGVTFTNEQMTISAELCKRSMEKNGVDECEIFTHDDIRDTEFYAFNKGILDNPKGAGFWLWKPYIIYTCMLEMQDDEILIYSDAGVEFVAPVSEIINRMDEDFFFFTNTHPQFHWCKREVMISMNMPLNIPTGQAQASVIFIKVNQITKDFIKRWLLWCQMPGLIDDTILLNEQAKEFQDHRHDQSILTNLILKSRYKTHWWPTAYAEHIRVPGDSYPMLFNHHRKRNDEWTK